MRQPPVPIPVNAHGLRPDARARLASIAGSGFLGVGVPSHLGGQGGTLEDLFREPAALQWLQGLQHADQLLFRSQRILIEALIQSDNIGLRELRLPELLSGALAGASTLESIPLTAKPLEQGWLLHGRLNDVPNLQWDGFSLLMPIQMAGTVEGILMIRSEENGLTVKPSATPALRELAAYGEVHFNKVFLRADEWLGGQPLWASLVRANQLLRNGLLNSTGR